MPKTLKEQRQEGKAKGSGIVSIKIQKPKLTINGFVVNREAAKKEEKERSRSSKSIKSKKSNSLAVKISEEDVVEPS